MCNRSGRVFDRHVSQWLFQALAAARTLRRHGGQTVFSHGFLKRPGTKRGVYYLYEGDPPVSERVNVSASRLILRLKIIRGPTAVTTREESWGAYLSERSTSATTINILFTSKLHGSLDIPWEFHGDRIASFPDVLSYPDSGRNIAVGADIRLFVVYRRISWIGWSIQIENHRLESRKSVEAGKRTYIIRKLWNMSINLNDSFRILQRI